MVNIPENKPIILWITVDGCEILHHLGWYEKPNKTNVMFTTVETTGDSDFAGPHPIIVPESSQESQDHLVRGFSH